MDAVNIKALAISQLGGTQFQVKPDLSVVYFEGNETEPSDSDITNKIAEIEVQEARKNSYQSIADQLDMQYWDNVNGTTTWKDHIAQVKADNPKP
jgi:hypothetical protein|tara:strand:+ start:4091 stop:4375 length:285 start_codon:yes stop_codon:yes gene_type:complete